jgi:hypothetical protein
MMLVYPGYLWGATNFYDRFAVMLLPTYAVMFDRAAAGEPRAALPRAQPVMLLLFVAVAVVLGRETMQNLAFARETRGIDALLARMPPNRRMLYVPVDKSSSAAGLQLPYVHYALWYQARHGGLVEFNFATLLPQIVRYRDFRRHVDPDWSWYPLQRMPWSRFQHDGYAYVLFRSVLPPGPAMLEADTCRLVPVDAVAEWWLYRNSCVP